MEETWNSCFLSTFSMWLVIFKNFYQTFPSVISFPGSTSPNILSCSCYWSHFVPLSILTALLCTFFLLLPSFFKEANNALKHVLSAEAYTIAFCHSVSNLSRRRLFLLSYGILVYLRDFSEGHEQMAFAYPGGFDEVDLPFPSWIMMAGFHMYS